MSIFLYSHLFLNCLQNSSRPRRTIGEIVNEARTLGSGQVDAVSGVEIDLADFTDIRFGQDRRLDEVGGGMYAVVLLESTICQRGRTS